MQRAPLSVIVPTLNAENGLPATLGALADANAAGLIREVVVSDGGSSDATLALAEEAGCTIVEGAAGRGAQLVRGAAAARGEWLLFLHADTALSPFWEEGAARAMKRDEAAYVFKLAFDAPGLAPRLVAGGANLRTALLRLPYGDQGLLISRRRYDALGGYAPLPLFEDVDMIRRLVRKDGRAALKVLPARASTSPIRYEREGYVRRVLANQRLLLSYLSGVSPARLKERYG